ncbi:MAG: STAS domain-containing protein [Spirochaetes bacterium]|nr:STAS domain-containing protein [Spirochaetota bacterium]
MNNSIIANRDNVVVVTEKGFCGIAGENLQKKICQTALHASRVVLDLRYITALDSVQMSFLVKMHLLLRKQKKILFLRNISESVMGVFRNTNLDKNFYFDLHCF